MSKDGKQFNGLEVDYNYGTLEQSAKKGDGIYLSKKYLGFNSSISLTVEEARWMAETILEFADKLEEIKYALPDTFFFKYNDGGETLYKAVKQNDTYVVYWDYDTRKATHCEERVKRLVREDKWEIVETEVM